MNQRELQSIIRLLARGAKVLEPSSNYRHKELERLMRVKVKQLKRKIL